MIKGCIFDLDGTLLNTLTSINYYVNKSLAGAGFGNITEEQTAVFVGDGAKALIERALGANGIDIKNLGDFVTALTKEYVEDYNANPEYLTKPYDTIPELLDKLKKRGMKLGVVSNKPHSTVLPLVQRFFPGVFDAVSGGKSGIPLKPAPEAPLMQCEELGLSPSEIAYFGDTGTDMKTGKAFSAALTVGVSWGFRSEEELVACGADATIDSPLEILDLV